MPFFTASGERMDSRTVTKKWGEKEKINTHLQTLDLPLKSDLISGVIARGYLKTLQPVVR